MSQQLPLEETSYHKSKDAHGNRSDHRTRFRAEQRVIDTIVSAATSVDSSFEHTPDPLPWKPGNSSFAQDHSDFDGLGPLDAMGSRREELRK